MPQAQTRRRVLSTMVFAGASATMPMLCAAGAEPRLETTSVRLQKAPVICFAPLDISDELLRVEGFTDIRYVETAQTTPEIGQGFPDNKLDFAANVTPGNVSLIDAGLPVKLVAGVHAGCYELFAKEGIRNVRDLKGKRVGTNAGADLIELMAAYVGLDPKNDLTIVSDRSAEPLEQFIGGKLDAYMALPPEPQQLHARGVRESIVRTATDPPWSQYFCCTLAARSDFVAKNPVATKRVIRAMLKAADLCASEPERAARRLVDGGFVDNYNDALQTLNDNPYGHWRDYDAEDTVRFYALRLHELGMVKRTPQQIIADGTDMRAFNELKRELKA